MSLKQILKEARSNIDSNNFKEGLSLSLKALSLDKSNYTAFLFAALSSASLNSIPDAVSFYQSAITVDPLLPAAHQGLLKITDPTNSLYFNSLISLIDIFSTIDPLKCYNHIRTLILHSTNSTVIDSLLLLSPTSKYYNYLKSLDSLPSPLEIYSEAAEKQESIDLKTTNQEIDARRSRLNSDPIAVIKSSVESKVTLASRVHISNQARFHLL